MTVLTGLVCTAAAVAMAGFATDSRAGGRIEFGVDTRNLHFFDPDSGLAFGMAACSCYLPERGPEGADSRCCRASQGDLERVTLVRALAGY